MKTKSLLLLLIVAFMTSCSPKYHEYTAIIEFDNQSNHNVELANILPHSGSLSDKMIITDATLATGEKFEYSHILLNSHDFLSSISRRSPYITFDDTYRVCYNDEGLPFVGQVVMQEEENGDPRYIFTITDADYDYAVEFGFKLVKPTE